MLMEFMVDSIDECVLLDMGISVRRDDDQEIATDLIARDIFAWFTYMTSDEQNQKQKQSSMIY